MWTHRQVVGRRVTACPITCLSVSSPLDTFQVHLVALPQWWSALLRSLAFTATAHVAKHQLWTPRYQFNDIG